MVFIDVIMMIFIVQYVFDDSWFVFIFTWYEAHNSKFLTSYFYKEMGVHVLDAVIRDWLEDPPPQHHKPCILIELSKK